MKQLVYAVLGLAIVFTSGADLARAADADSAAKAKKRWEKAHADALEAIAKLKQARAQLAAADPRNPALGNVDNRLSYAQSRVVDRTALAAAEAGVASNNFPVAVSNYHKLTAFASSA